MRRETTIFLTVGLLVAIATSASAQPLYDYQNTPNNVAFLGTPYAGITLPGEFEGDPDITYENRPWGVVDNAICVGQDSPTVNSWGQWSEAAHYISWPGNFEDSRPDGIYSLQVDWDTAYDLTILNAYVSSGDTIGATDTDRVVSNVDFYVSYEPVGSTPVYTLAGSAMRLPPILGPGA